METVKNKYKNILAWDRCRNDSFEEVDDEAVRFKNVSVQTQRRKEEINSTAS